MSTAFGLIEFILYVVLIVGFAAAITWLVVRLTPPQRKPGGPAQS